MMATDVLNIGFDRYDRNARLKPALLTILPLLLMLAVWLEAAWAVAAGLLSLVVTCGLVLLLSRIARQRGRQVQQEIERRLGGLPTTLALRHRDSMIDPQTKARYHAFLRASGLRVPSTQEEGADPASADGDYQSCTKWLLEATRDKRRFRMIADENIDFGFRRNLLGLKPFGLAIALGCLVANSLALLVAYASAGALEWDGVALEVVLVLLTVIWGFVVRLEFVVDAGWSYATRLLASCDELSR